MDANYIRENVHGPLLEALLATVLANPDDKVEFLGKYLIDYVQRKHDDAAKEAVFKAAEELAIIERNHEIHIQNQIESQNLAKENKEMIFKKFISYDLLQMTSKQEVMNSICAFFAEHFDIPACYIAKRVKNDDKDTLEYIAANPAQTKVVLGKTLHRLESEEDVPERSGVSFEAFALNEQAEEDDQKEENEEKEDGNDDGDSNEVVKIAPKKRPLIVSNVMRDRRCKFFGAPKLGAFLAIPLSFESSEHVDGCVKVNPQEESPEGTDEEVEEGAQKTPKETSSSEPVYTTVSKTAEFLIAADTIGKFRQFTVYNHILIKRMNTNNIIFLLHYQEIEVDALATLGDALTDAFKRIEKNSIDRHMAYLGDIDAHVTAIDAAHARAVEEEAKGRILIAFVFTIPLSSHKPCHMPYHLVIQETEDRINASETTTDQEEGEANDTEEENKNEDEDAGREERKQLELRLETSKTALGVWTQVLLSDEVLPRVLSLEQYELPMPIPMQTLLLSTAKHLGITYISDSSSNLLQVSVQQTQHLLSES